MMKKKIYGLCMGFAAVFLLVCGQTKAVSAEQLTEKVELTEEERYDPRYYRPFGKTDGTEGIDATGAAEVNGKTFEETVAEQLRLHAELIDVSGFKMSSDAVHTDYFRTLFSNAELFFVDSAYSAYTNGGYVTGIVPQYNMSASAAEEALQVVDAAAEEALDMVSDDMEDYEKALAIHDWLAVYCEYDYEHYLANNVPAVSHTAYGALAQKVAVCDGYSKAYQYIMQNKLGISCLVVSSDSISHAWNLIEIGGQYYHVDVTWDDPTWDVIGRVTHNNFLLSDTGITKTGHSGWDEYEKASDTTFDSITWGKSDGSIIYDEGYWYYINQSTGELIKTDDILNGANTVLYTIDPKSWKADNAGSYYLGVFSYLQKYEDMLIFNEAKKITKYDLTMQTPGTLYIPSTAELPEDTDTAVYNICGFKVAEDMLCYAIQPNPYLEQSQSSYIHKTDVIEKITPDLPDELPELSGIAGKPLSSIILPEFYTWADPTVKMTQTGQMTYMAYYCPDKKVYKSVVVNLTVKVDCVEHEWNDGVITVQPTCSKEGEKTCSCIYCGVTTVLPVAVTDHQNIGMRNVITPTCVTAGYSGDMYCIDCQTLIRKGTVVPPTGHVWAYEGILTEATATEGGTVSYICVNCGEHKIVATAAMGAPEKGTLFYDDDLIYAVTVPGTSGGMVSVVKSTGSQTKTVVIPDAITVDGITYKVSAISAKAFKNHKKIRKIVIGTNVTSIGKDAFNGCKKLKNITIRSSKVKSVGKNAIKNIKKNARIYCPKKKLRAYKKLFNSKSGFKKTMKITK